MKQEAFSYLTTIKDEILDISKYIYNNPESSFHEYKCCEKIITLLEKNNFTVEKNFLDIPTTFRAQFGTGHPKICFICKYSALNEESHTYGTNAACSMILGSAISLTKVIPKLKGSIIVLGCSGNDFDGSELTISNQGCLDDIDVVIGVQANSETLESGTSPAVIPLQIKFTSDKTPNPKDIPNTAPIDALTITINAINHLIKKIDFKCDINILSIEGEENPYTYPASAHSKLFIRSDKMKFAEIIYDKITSFIKSTADLLDLDYDLSFFKTPYKELITNTVLSRLFNNNLKEVGIININCCKKNYIGLSVGSLSHTTPCIYPSISIIKDSHIKYPSKEFGEMTLSTYAEDIIIKTSYALACTVIDILEKPDLISEMTKEFFDQKV